MRADDAIVDAGLAASALASRSGEAGKRMSVIEQVGSDAGPFITDRAP
jgi:hypothetical protein